jgi:hypothetical protein
MLTRRQFAATTPWLVAAPLALSGCSDGYPAQSYEALAASTWTLGASTGFNGAALGRELVRLATLAPSSHNTQCWKFALGSTGRAITVLPDLARLCPTVDPDEHHLFVSPGCATENLVQAALAYGLQREALLDTTTGAVRVALEPVRAQTTDPFGAMALRQCTRGDGAGAGLCGTGQLGTTGG